MDTFPSFLSNDPLICPETGEESLLEKGFGDLQESRETVVILAGKHVSAACAQKKFAQYKVDAANESINEINPSKRTVTLVMDFCQNLDLPHLGGEQPGDTYYYSPIWLYCLGIVDVAEDRLYAYLYDESSAKKGANNVSSILLYHIITFVVNNFEYSEKIGELNIIMDNCRGQNKNGTVIKMAAYFVERGWFDKVNLIFLVKGHTKNDCDRMFNLLKVQWHKSNVYTFNQALAILGAVENVLPIDASNIHIDYTSLFEKWYKQPASGTIQKNHIFTFDKATIKNCLLTTKQSYNSDVTTTQSIKKIDKNTSEWVRKLQILHKRKTFLPKPGLKPIKQVHLFTKWRKVVPHPYKDEVCPLPSNEVIEIVLKRRPKKTKPVTSTLTNTTITVLPSVQTTTNTTRTVLPSIQTTPVARSTPPTCNSLEQSDDEGSEYRDLSFDPIELLQHEVRQLRGKTFLPPKPAAVRTKEQKKARSKDIAEHKERTKNEKKEVTKRRITTRNQKKLDREKKEPPSKRLCSRQSYYNKHNISTLMK